jgi:hypothetical protein
LKWYLLNLHGELSINIKNTTRAYVEEKCEPDGPEIAEGGKQAPPLKDSKR